MTLCPQYLSHLFPSSFWCRMWQQQQPIYLGKSWEIKFLLPGLWSESSHTMTWYVQISMRQLSLAWLGSARLGSARLGSARLGSARLGEVLSLYQVLWLALIDTKCCILFAFYLGCGFSQISRRPWGAEYSVSSLFITDVMTNDLKYISSLSHLVTPLPLACDKSMFQ